MVVSIDSCDDLTHPDVLFLDSSRSFAAKPFKTSWWMYAFWPMAIQIMILVRIFIGKVLPFLSRPAAAAGFQRVLGKFLRWPDGLRR